MDGEASAVSLSSFFRLDRKQVIVLATLLFILVAGALYFFIYIPSNRRHVEDLRFRAIQNIDRNIDNKIKNSVELMNRLLIAYERDSTNAQTYINTFKSINFKLSLISKADRQDSSTFISMNRNHVKIGLINKRLRINMEYLLPKFVDPLLSGEAFDNYLLVGSNNEIIYQTFPSGITTLGLDSLDRKLYANNSVRNIRLGGTAYKLFRQRIRLDSTNYVTLAGLLKAQKYQQLNTSLPENLVVLMLFIMLALVLCLPWIKLYHMGSQDRLTVFDGLFAFASSLLLLAFLVFAFLKYNKTMRPGEDPFLVSSRSLAHDIKNAYKQDIISAYRVITSVDSARRKDKLARSLSDISPAILDKQTSLTQSFQDLQSAKLLAGLLRGVDMVEMFGLDTTGEEKYNYNRRQSAPLSNYGDRIYFKQIIEGRPNHIKVGKEEIAFGLEQVVSWTTGSFITVVSRAAEKNDSVTCVAIAFTPKSVTRPLLPKGFTFAIADQTGKVLYHSYPFKNLNENLVEEFSETDLLPILSGKEATVMETKYGEKTFNVYVLPFSELPYNIVIFEDAGFTSERDTKVFVFTFSLLLVFFLFLAILFVVIYLLYQRPSFLKKHYFDITWLGPNAKFKPRYLLVIGFNLVIICLLLIFSLYTSLLQFLFILLFAATSVSIFLNSQYKRSYFRLGDDKFKQKKRAVSTLWCIVGIIATAAFVNTDFKHFGLFAAVAGVFWLVYARFTSRMRQRRSLLIFTGKFRLSACFTTMVFTRLIIMSALPVAYFFTFAYNHESSLLASYRHRQFVSEYGERQGAAGLPKDAGVFYDGVWILPGKQLEATEQQADQLTKWLQRKLMEYVPHGEEMFYAGADKMGGYTRVGSSTITHFPDGTKPYEILAANTAYALPTPVEVGGIGWKGISYWLIFAGALILFVFLLHRVIRKLFALNLPKQTGWDEIDEQLLVYNDQNAHLFMIGPPGASVIELIRKEIKSKRYLGLKGLFLNFGIGLPGNVYIADMLMIPDNEKEASTNRPWLKIQRNAANKKYKLIIVNHFEYDLQNANTNRIKLNFLEELTQRSNCKIIIVSTVHPINFLDSLNQLENRKPVGQRQPAHDLERWHVVLCHFKIIIRGIKDMKPGSSFRKPVWERELKAELQSGQFLSSMQNPTLLALNPLPQSTKASIHSDSLAFKMEITSHYYYMGLWQSLTKEEKFILYDLAEDGLVNPFDDYNLTLLIRKGLILQTDAGLSIFNVGFRHFILTSIGTTEVMKIRSQISDNGTWNSFRIPLTILIVAVFAFLFASQQEAYETLLKYLSVLTISVPTALKFFAMFEKTPKSS